MNSITQTTKDSKTTHITPTQIHSGWFVASAFRSRFFNTVQVRQAGFLLFCLCFCFFEVVLAVFLLESLYSPCRIDKFLLTGIERMACRADFRMNFLSCTGSLERIAATATNHYLIIFWMYLFFHNYNSYFNNIYSNFNINLHNFAVFRCFCREKTIHLMGQSPIAANPYFAVNRNYLAENHIIFKKRLKFCMISIDIKGYSYFLWRNGFNRTDMELWQWRSGMLYHRWYFGAVRIIFLLSMSVNTSNRLVSG